MEIEQSKIFKYLKLFELLNKIGVLPEYKDITIVINNDVTKLHFNSNEIISNDKLMRILFNKYENRLLPMRYPANAFNTLLYLLKNNIENKHELWKGGIDYNTHMLIFSQHTKSKLGRIFYIEFSYEISPNINKIMFIHYNTMMEELNLIYDEKLNTINNFETIKNNYINDTFNINNNINEYNKLVRKIRRLQKRIR
jgi:hypothetical protein